MGTCYRSTGLKELKELFNSFTGYQHAFLQAGIEWKLSAGNLYLFKSGSKKAKKLANGTKILAKKNLLCAFHTAPTLHMFPFGYSQASSSSQAS